MKKNAILILANNLDFFKLFVENYPKELCNEFYQLIVVNETRIGDKTKDINKILDVSNIDNYKVFTSDLICDTFKKKVIDNDFVDDYTMSMNILALWFVKKHNKNIEKILLLDDDVILREGITNIFEEDHHLFKSNRLSAGPADFEKQSKHSKEVFEEWFKIFNIKFTNDWWKDYLKKYSNSGQRLIIMNKFNIERYEEKLIKFFESECFFETWVNRNTHTSWYFDERFETFFFFDDLNNDLNKSTFLVLTRREKFNNGTINKMLNSSIIHNATNSHKINVYNFMIENNIIKGEML